MLGHRDEASRCTLEAGGTSTDYAETEAGFGDFFGTTRATLHMNVLASFTGPGTITLSCRSDGHHFSDPPLARQSKIVVIQVESIARSAFGG